MRPCVAVVKVKATLSFSMKLKKKHSRPPPELEQRDCLRTAHRERDRVRACVCEQRHSDVDWFWTVERDCGLAVVFGTQNDQVVNNLTAKKNWVVQKYIVLF